MFNLIVGSFNISMALFYVFFNIYCERNILGIFILVINLLLGIANFNVYFKFIN